MLRITIILCLECVKSIDKLQMKVIWKDTVSRAAARHLCSAIVSQKERIACYSLMRYWHVFQAWLVVLLVVTARSQAPYVIAGGIAFLSIIALPQRLWSAQLKRLGLLCFFLFITTAIFAGRLSSTVFILSRMACSEMSCKIAHALLPCNTG